MRKIDLNGVKNRRFALEPVLCQRLASNKYFTSWS